MIMNIGSVNNKSKIINGKQTQITGNIQAHNNDFNFIHSVCCSTSEIIKDKVHGTFTSAIKLKCIRSFDTTPIH